MKKIRKYVFACLVLLGVGLFFAAGKPVSAEDMTAVVIDGIEYNLTRKQYAVASIDRVRGDNLKSEIYIPSSVEYEGTTYRVRQFYWGDMGTYDKRRPSFDRQPWKTVDIADKEHSYYACLRKITIAKGVLVHGMAYQFDKLKEVVLEDANDMLDAYYNQCPNLKTLFINANISENMVDIKNCPSLQVTIDSANPYMQVIGQDIYSKDGKALYDVVNGSKVYYVRKGVKRIVESGLSYNTSIEKLYLPDSVIHIGGETIENLPNLKKIRFGKNMDIFHWGWLEGCPKVKKVYVPAKVEEIHYNYVFEKMKSVKKIYLYSRNLKKGNLEGAPKFTTIYVKNAAVKKQLKKFGFKGKVVVKKKMKKYK